MFYMNNACVYFIGLCLNYSYGIEITPQPALAFEGGQGGHVPSEIATLKILCLNSMEFLTFNQIFSTIFGFLWALPQTPPSALYLRWIT